MMGKKSGWRATSAPGHLLPGRPTRGRPSYTKENKTATTKEKNESKSKIQTIKQQQEKKPDSFVSPTCLSTR